MARSSCNQPKSHSMQLIGSLDFLELQTSKNIDESFCKKNYELNGLKFKLENI